ncbi:MAG TPA: Dabb family protein [Chitinophagaceae bacterium]|nr:Dabb family protein [Chitinophagaceae bacterium]
MRTRRSFITTAALAAPALLLANVPQATEDNIFVHHVYFWLKNPGSKTDRDKLVEGLKKLSKVRTIKMSHIGQPADTDRPVIDRSYAVSWLVIFKNKADQDSYQSDPIHLRFVDECSALWSKVVVYDSINV